MAEIVIIEGVEHLLDRPLGLADHDNVGAGRDRFGRAVERPGTADHHHLAAPLGLPRPAHHLFGLDCHAGHHDGVASIPVSLADRLKG